VNHHIAITWAKRKAEGRIVGIGSYFATYKGVVIGEWRVPECSAARCHASHSDILVTTRNGRPAMSGNVGWLADHTVEENDKVSPRWAKYRPFDLGPASEDLDRHRAPTASSSRTKPNRRRSRRWSRCGRRGRRCGRSRPLSGEKGVRISHEGVAGVLRTDGAK